VYGYAPTKEQAKEQYQLALKEYLEKRPHYKNNKYKIKGLIMKINYVEVKKLKSFYGVQLKGNETFDELLNIEKNYS
jgi:hypothetical protein